MTRRYFLTPSEINRMPLDLVEAYLDPGDAPLFQSDSEADVIRFLASMQ